jgi:hypothetical protein
VVIGGATMVSTHEKYPGGSQYNVLDSVDILNDLLEQIWHTLCCTYDANGNLPDVNTLFEGINLNDSGQAANTIVANMLLDLMENIGRFSPWYTRPTRSFGLVSIREPVSKHNRWMLAPEAVYKWQNYLDRLSKSIERNYSMLKAMMLVEDLMRDNKTHEPLIIARCSCSPPRTIQLTESVLKKAEILCDACMQPFL